MRKGILAVGAMLMLGGSMQVNADTKICVFDLLGKSGEAYKAMEEWALAAKKSINSLAKAKGKKFAYLKHDDAQRKILEAIGMVGLPSDVSDFAKKFNANQADVIASPAYAYKALEIEKGLGTIGAMFDNVPVVNITIELIIRPNSFPAGFSLNSREWFIQQIPTSFAMIKRLEDAIPTKYKYSISKEEVENYEKLFREQRIRFTKDGIYDPVMMGVLKRARCSVERTRFECSLGGE